MTKSSKRAGGEGEGNPKEGDAILRRMLQMQPKPYREMVEERHKNARPNQKPSRASSRQRSKES